MSLNKVESRHGLVFREACNFPDLTKARQWASSFAALLNQDRQLTAEILKESPQILVVDVGGNKIDVRLSAFSEKLAHGMVDIGPHGQDHWQYYKTNNETGSAHDYCWLDGKEIYSQIKQRIVDLKNDGGGKNPDLLVLTGLVHNLVLIHEHDGIKEYRVIADEPSLIADLSEREEQLVAEFTKGKNGNGKVKKESALMKLIAIKHHPEIIRHMFGADVSLDKLRVSTMMGMVSEEITGIRGVPLANVKAFATVDGKSAAETNLLLEKLELPQVHFVNDLKYHGQRVEVINDLDVEMKLFKKLGECGFLSPKACMVAFGSVGKMIVREPKLGIAGNKINARVSEGMAYVTQRVMGTIFKTFAKEAMGYLTWVETVDGKVYRAVDILAKKHQLSLPKGVFFFPNVKEVGELRFFKEETSREITREMINSLPKDERSSEQYGFWLWRVLCGLACQTRNNIEGMAQAFNSHFDEFCLTDGPSQDESWRQAFAQILPQGIPVYALKMQSAAEAAQIMYAWENGWLSEDNFRRFWPPDKKVLVAPATRRDAEYEEWKKKQKECF